MLSRENDLKLIFVKLNIQLKLSRHPIPYKFAYILCLNVNKQYFLTDNENDMISFSSDDELIDALGFVGDGIFRIYIKADSPVPPSNQTPAGPEHFGVVCDGCEGKVFGKRFKCQQCPNYDLCSSCRGTGLHGHHNFSEIESPSFQVRQKFHSRTARGVDLIVKINF